MKISAVVRALVAARATPDMILAAVEAAELENENALEKRRMADRESTASRRARMDVPEAEWNALRQLVFDRDGYVCAYCGADNGDFHVDHVTPIARGGTSELSNLCVACKPCNQSKGPRLLSEWRGR